MLMRKTA